MTTTLQPIHPGEILREEFLKPFGLSVTALAKALHTDAPRIHDIVNEKRSISPDTALRLARYFRTTPEFWVNLQAHYDLRIARAERESEIERDVRPRELATA
jgi:addiction module HigA family antidote